MTDALKRRLAADLKLKPLIDIDPNDQVALDTLVEQALQKCQQLTLATDQHDVVCLMAQTLNHLGQDFDTQAWAKRILEDTHDSDEQKLHELHLYQIVEQAGIAAIDFATYCILKFKRRVPNQAYESSDIHYASDMGLRIAEAHGIHDLLNTYACVELVLLLAGDFTTNPLCARLQEVFRDQSRSSDQKINFAYAWLNDNIAAVYAAMD